MFTHFVRAHPRRNGCAPCSEMWAGFGGEACHRMAPRQCGIARGLAAISGDVLEGLGRELGWGWGCRLSPNEAHVRFSAQGVAALVTSRTALVVALRSDGSGRSTVSEVAGRCVGLAGASVVRRMRLGRRGFWAGAHVHPALERYVARCTPDQDVVRGQRQTHVRLMHSASSGRHSGVLHRGSSTGGAS